MLKLNSKKTLLTLFLLCFLFFAPVSFGQDSTDFPKQIQAEQSFDTVKVHDLEIEPINTSNVKKNVVPDSKKEAKKVMFLFLKTMFGVVICAILLYFLLLFVRKYYGVSFIATDTDEEELDLANPENKQEALKMFLRRSK